MNLRKGLTSSKTITVALLITAFYLYHLSSLSTLSSNIGVKVSPWVFTHMFSQTCMLLNGLFLTALFSNMPNTDSQMYFVIIRTGRQNWIWGQICYIVVMSLIYTMFTFVISIIALIPNVRFTSEWGSILKTLAVSRGTAAVYGVTIDYYINEAIILNFSAVQATLISLGLFWLTAVFAGSIILGFNTMLKNGSGMVVSGLFSCMCFFSYYGGSIIFGTWISYISPYLWATMYYLNWGYAGLTTPTPKYVAVFLSCGIILMCFIFARIFKKKDIYANE